MKTPQSLHKAFEHFVNLGQVGGLATLYEERAALVLKDGQIVSGVAAITDHFAGLLAIKPKMTIDQAQVVDAGDMAVLIANWRLTIPGPTGESVAEQGRTYDVARRQSDGTWRIVFDSPWGMKSNLS